MMKNLGMAVLGLCLSGCVVVTSGQGSGPKGSPGQGSGGGETPPADGAGAASGDARADALRQIWKDFDRRVPCDSPPQKCVSELAREAGVPTFNDIKVWNPAKAMSTLDEVWLPGWDKLSKFEDGESAHHTFEAIWLAGSYRRAKAKCLSEAGAKIEEMKRGDEAKRASIGAAKAKKGLYEQLPALFGLRAAWDPKATTGERWQAWAGGGFEVEQAIAGLFDDPAKQPVYVTIGAPPDLVRPYVRARGDATLEADAICAFAKYQLWTFDGPEKAVKLPYGEAETKAVTDRLSASGSPLSTRWNDIKAAPELKPLDFDTAEDPNSAPGSVVRVGGNPGSIAVSGSAYVTVEVDDVKKDGADLVVTAKMEHDTQILLGCGKAKDRLVVTNGTVQHDKSCKYGSAWGRRVMTIRLAEAPPGGIEKKDRIAFFAKVESNKEKKTETAAKKVREQALSMTGSMVYYVGRGNAVSYAFPR